MTGCRPLPQPSSSGCGSFVQPPSAAQASYSSNVTSNLPTANGLAMTTSWTGFSSSSPSACPIMNLPAGTTTISGHLEQSRKVVPGAGALDGVSGSAAPAAAGSECVCACALLTAPATACSA